FHVAAIRPRNAGKVCAAGEFRGPGAFVPGGVLLALVRVRPVAPTRLGPGGDHCFECRVHVASRLRAVGLPARAVLDRGGAVLDLYRGGRCFLGLALSTDRVTLRRVDQPHFGRRSDHGGGLRFVVGVLEMKRNQSTRKKIKPDSSWSTDSWLI